MWQTAAEWHAALNDLPPALFLASVVFDLVGNATKRETLRAAGFWSLVAGAIGAVAAVTSGLIAEESIEHGDAAHEIMERHEWLAISVSALFVILAAWRIWRKGNLGPQENPPYLVAATVGALGVIWVAHLGGTIVFRHGGGIPSPVLTEALEERAAGHQHEAGEESDTAAVKDSASHTHAPGTPPRNHD